MFDKDTSINNKVNEDVVRTLVRQPSTLQRMLAGLILLWLCAMLFVSNSLLISKHDTNTLKSHTTNNNHPQYPNHLITSSEPGGMVCQLLQNSTLHRPGEEIWGVPTSISERVALTMQAAVDNNQWTFGKEENPPNDTDIVRNEFQEEMCLQLAASKYGYGTTYRMQTRENDRRSCRVGLWSWACNKNALTQPLVPIQILDPQDSAIRSNNSNTAGVVEHVAFLLLLTDSSFKGFFGMELIETSVAFLSAEADFYVLIHVADNSSPEFKNNILQFVTKLNRPNVKLMPYPLQTNWGSYSIVQAELASLAYLLTIKEWPWQAVINFSGNDLPVSTTLEMKAHLSRYPPGASVFHGHRDQPDSFPPDRDRVWLTSNTVYPSSLRVGRDMELLNLLMEFAGWDNSRLTYCRGGQWHMISRKMAYYLVSCPACERLFDQVWRYTFAPDETYFHVILANINKQDELFSDALKNETWTLPATAGYWDHADPGMMLMTAKSEIHYVANREKLREIDKSDFEAIRQGKYLLARKWTQLSRWKDFWQSKQ